MKFYNTQINELLKVLFPINRSITGKGNYHTLLKLKELIPIKIKKYKSGTRVYDWIIPNEWNVIDAWIKDNSGNKIIDFKINNLHLVSYSKSIYKSICFKELKKRLYFDINMPDAIPYRTSYYKNDWGFCVNKEQFNQLKNANGNLEVYINTSSKNNGDMHFGEIIIPGKRKKEILISTYLCHPSMANDNLSGIILTTFLTKEILKIKNRLNTYRIIFVPETIGAIAYCQKNEKKIKEIDVGLVVTTVGGPGKLSYKQSWDKNHYINNIVKKVLSKESDEFIEYPFDIHGSDERQFSSQAFRINTVTVSKSKYYEYSEYHTSLDNLNFIKAKYILTSLNIYKKIINELECVEIYETNMKYCEPMLSKHGLYPEVGGKIKPKIGNIASLDIILWLIFLSDGNTSVDQLSEKININKSHLSKIAKILIKHKILRKI